MKAPKRRATKRLDRDQHALTGDRRTAPVDATPLTLDDRDAEELLSSYASAYDEDPEHAQHRVVCNLALLIRWTDAEQSCDRGGTNIELELVAGAEGKRLTYKQPADAGTATA